MTDAPVSSAPDRRAHEQQQLAEALASYEVSRPERLTAEAWHEFQQRAAVLLAPDGAVTILAAERVAEALAPVLALADAIEADAQANGVAPPSIVARIRAAAPQPTDRQEQDR